MNPLFLVGGAIAAALLLLGGAMSTPSSSLSLPAWVHKVLATVIGHESRFNYAAMNLNKDGAGMSFGIIQWAQGPGSLGIILTAMHNADPARFEAIMGPSWAQVIKIASSKSLAPVDNAVLWVEPWVSRFRALGNDPVFQQVQLATAASDKHWIGAMDVSRALGVLTERSMALFYDTAVQQGPRGAMATAERARAALTKGQTVSVEYRALLAEYARQAAAPYRRPASETPPSPWQSKHLVWKRAPDGTWHTYAGAWDMYEDILKRRTAILNDASLSDTAIAA